NFTEHQNHIERSGRALLAIYREANRKTRPCPAPSYFTKPFNLARIIYLGNEPNESARDQLRQSIIDSQNVLKSQIQAIHEAFEQAARSYREIDDLIPQDKSGSVAKQKA